MKRNRYWVENWLRTWNHVTEPNGHLLSKPSSTSVVATFRWPLLDRHDYNTSTRELSFQKLQFQLVRFRDVSFLIVADVTSTRSHAHSFSSTNADTSLLGRQRIPTLTLSWYRCRCRHLFWDVSYLVVTDVTSPWSHAHSLIRQTSPVLRLDRQRIPTLTLSWFRRHYRLLLDVNKLIVADAVYQTDEIIVDHTTSRNSSMSCCKYCSTPTRRGLLLCDWTAWLMTAFSTS